MLWHQIGVRPERPYFRRHILVRLRPFLSGMSGTSVILLLTTQLDKAILSRLLPLAMFGYYTLAWSAASNLLRFVSPVQQAFFPQLAGALARQDHSHLDELYHRKTQILVVLTGPLALLLTHLSGP